MPASPEELIAINRLLIEREAEYARLHRVESRINALLGGAYPFEAPQAEFPSSIKKNTVKAKKAPAKAKPIKARRLNEGEAGYRLRWIDQGQHNEQSATDLKQVKELLNHTLPGMKLLKIETVDIRGNAVETLFENQDRC